ncbi:STAND family AAA ATPase [Chitinimonas lacunae]|uniref:Metallophosphoesterase n=1 Tax=Chitinimonas lacunae TaxID=1963018 RepID=A0ABV8MSR4_9NEIS
MSKLAVIHLSDIHIHGSADSCLRHIEAIAETCYTTARAADACLLAISGDIAFSGTVAEYRIADTLLLRPLLAALQQETGRTVQVAMVPGNHDCTLRPRDEVRETLVQAVIEAPDKAQLEEIVRLCARVQDNFFDFASRWLLPVAEQPSALFWQQRFDVLGEPVLVSSLNAAWMSRLPEVQGQMVYPITRFEPLLDRPAALHLALVHHPLNWYAQADYQQLRRRLRQRCSAILSGHEHLANTGQIAEQLSGNSLFFEAPALQAHEADADQGFGLYLFDLVSKQVDASTFLIGHDGRIRPATRHHHTWEDKDSARSALDIAPAFAAELNDAGGNFTHSAKERVTLEDIFVWPDLRDWESKEINTLKTRSSQELVGKLQKGRRFTVYGDEKAGKTTLLYWLFRELLGQGYAPLYLLANNLSIKGGDDLERRIVRVIESEYRHPDLFARQPRERKILLLDDIDRLRAELHTLPLILDYASRHFSGICLTATTGFEVTNLTSKEASAALAPFVAVELLRFGFKLRHSLIKKWCSLSAVATKAELDQRIDEVESIVNAVIGRQLVPEYPIYLLILLQSCEQHRHGEIQNSGLSFYYQYLITKSLGEVGVKPTELDEHFNYLSLLAWELNRQGLKAIELGELGKINAEFSRRFVTVDLKDRLTLLTRALILTRQGDSCFFTYPYVYYFFVGRYLARNLDQPAIRAWVEDSCKKLYLRDRALTVMFLTHHVDNQWVIELICQVLRECFADKKPIELNGDTKYLNKLVETTAQLTFPQPDVERNQLALREFSDQIVEAEKRHEPDEYDMLSFAARWNLLNKTAEILGLILKNYYGSLERPQKQAMIREVFDGPMRALRLWLEQIAASLPDFIEELRQIEHERHAKATVEEAEQRIKHRLFNLLGWVATNAVASAASFVASDKLREDIREVVQSNPTNAYRLIETATRLLRPNTVPLDKIKTLAKDLDKNPYAFGVLQSLGLYHMYMFHMDEPTRQSLSNALKISFSATRTLTPRRKKNKRLK